MQGACQEWWPDPRRRARVPEANDWIGPAWLPPHYGDLSEVQLRDATTTQRIASLHPEGVRIMALMLSDGILYYEFVGHHPCDGRMLCKAFRDNSSIHFEGPKNKERGVKLWRSNGNPVWFAGDRHQEYEVREIQPDGEIQEYVGKKHEESIVSSTWPGELTQHYRGPRGAEHLVKVEWTDGNSMLFVGPKGRERKVRELLANGTLIDYVGNKGNELILRKVAPNGIETCYQVFGPYLGAICRIKHMDGSYIDYDGPKDKERMIARMDTDCERRLTLFDGKRGHEYKTKVCWLRSDFVIRPGEDRGEHCKDFQSDDFWQEHHFLGRRGEERLVRIWTKPERGNAAGNTTRHLVGPWGKERLRQIDSAGRRDFYRPDADGRLYMYKTEFADGSTVTHTASEHLVPAARAAAAATSGQKKQKRNRASNRDRVDAEAARRAAVRRRWRSAAWRAVRLERALAEATRANAEAAARQAAVREQCDAAKAARPERAYTAQGPSHREGAATWVAGDAPDAAERAKRVAEKDASREAVAEAKAARAALLKRGNEEYLEQMRLLRVAEAIGGSK